MRILTCLFTEHNLWLVSVAAILCVSGSAIGVQLYQKLRRAAEGARTAWLFLGAVAIGATIWCTHFVAMLAYNPSTTVSYEPVLTGASLVIAILGSALALVVGAMRFRAAGLAAGAIFGTAVAAMHYTGMAAFTVEAFKFWSPVYLVASVALSIVLGAAGFHQVTLERGRIHLIIAAGLITGGIVSLHFTGMAALTVVPLAPLDDQAGTSGAFSLAFAVSGVGLMILGTGFASQALDEDARRLSKLRLEQLVEGSVDGMVVESAGRITAANAAFAGMVGVEQTQLIGRSLEEWLPTADMPVGQLRSMVLGGTGPAAGAPVEVALRHVDGGSPQSAVAEVYAIRDLTYRMAQERRIAHLARNDSLTGLPNRASFLEYVTRRVEDPAANHRFSLLAIDLDRFKEINDVHGHSSGDQVLTELGKRLADAAKHIAFVARLGGDEFVAIAPVSNRDAAGAVAETLRRALTSDVDLGHATVSCGASVGIAIWPDDADDLSSFINNADLAMYRAKSSPVQKVCFYEGEMDETVRQRRRITQDLREALATDALELHYQIQVDAGSRKQTGFEALLRWRRTDGSYTPPSDFIPLAEQTGLILPIGEWVLRRACADAAGWAEPHRVAVNLSPIQLGHVDLPRLVHEILLETGLSPSRLELEITETAMISDPERTTHVLRQLKLLGVSIAMDDFGTGYSSLSTLRAFPFDKIKLDRSFMNELETSTQPEAIIRAVLALADSLDIPVLAEGVETETQMRFLQDHGCDEVQGFLLGRPGPLCLTDESQDVDKKIA